MPIINRVADLADEITLWRRDMHENPELQYDVHRTARIVAEKIKAFGCDEVVPGVGKTGVVGVIRGRKYGSGRVLGLRADMDALPIVESTGLPYASKTAGKNQVDVRRSCYAIWRVCPAMGAGRLTNRGQLLDADRRASGQRPVRTCLARPSPVRGPPVARHPIVCAGRAVDLYDHGVVSR